jgi:hypothetical protein
VTHSAATVQEALRLFALGHPKKSIARELGISAHAVTNWVAREPDELLAERVASGDHDPSVCPLIERVPAREYAYLLGQYLGDGSIARHRRDVYRLVITCCDDYPDIRERTERAMAAVLPNGVGRVQGKGCTNVSAYSKHWPCLFPQHGPGHKHTRRIELVPWQSEIVASHTGQVLRGLFDSDGSRCINRVRRPVKGVSKSYEYPRYFFSNTSMDILQICGDALDLLGIEWRFNNRNSISVARRAAVARLDEFVGPKS